MSVHYVLKEKRREWREGEGEEGRERSKYPIHSHTDVATNF